MTFNTLCNMLGCADRNDYIEDDDEYEAVADAFDEYLDDQEFALEDDE